MLFHLPIYACITFVLFATIRFSVDQKFTADDEMLRKEMVILFAWVMYNYCEFPNAAD